MSQKRKRREEYSPDVEGVLANIGDQYLQYHQGGNQKELIEKLNEENAKLREIKGPVICGIRLVDGVTIPHGVLPLGAGSIAYGAASAALATLGPFGVILALLCCGGAIWAGQKIERALPVEYDIRLVPLDEILRQGKQDEFHINISGEGEVEISDRAYGMEIHGIRTI